MSTLVWLLSSLGAVAAAVAADRFLMRRRDRLKLGSAAQRARQILDDAERESANRLREAAIEAQEKLDAAEERFEAETQERRREIDTRERRVEEREANLERRVSFLDQRQRETERREETLKDAEAKMAEASAALAHSLAQQRDRLERVAGMSAEAAKQELMRGMEEEARRDAVVLLRKVEEETRQQAHQEAVRTITRAISRVPFVEVVEATLSVIELPDDEMKGRIIGREGRNIRAIEMTTGVDLIVDDTPNAILLSSYDPLRREVACLAIQRLLEDGRIHPARIEEVVAKVRSDTETWIAEAGQAAAFELELHDLHPRLLQLVGRMKYHTLHSLNLLHHCKEVAVLAAHMAAQLEVKVETAKRAGLLHEIGQVEERNPYATPILLSAELAQKYGENEGVVHAIQALHRDVAPKTVEAVLLQSAELIAMSRPGARKDNVSTFVGRLTNLEQIARSFAGVKEAFAVKAGREVRVIVDAEKISDEQGVWLSRDIAARIEHELQYPSQIKVSVIRETRAIGYAV